MRKLLCLLVLALSMIGLRAANPAFGDFNANQFATNANKIAIKNGAVTTNLISTGTLGAFNIHGSNNFIWDGTADFNDTLDAITISVSSGLTAFSGAFTNSLTLGGTNVTIGSGTPNTVAKWTGTNTLGDSLITSDNANNIIGAGANFTGTVIDTTTDIYAVGRGTLDTAAVTNSFDIYSFGDVNFGNAIINSADNLFGMGDATFQNAIVDSSNEIFAWGQQVFNTSTNVNSSTFLFGIGNGSFGTASIDGSSDIYGIGLNAMNRLAATNSTMLVGIGETPFNDTWVTDSTEMFGFGDSSLRFSIFESCQRLYGFGNALYVVTITNATDMFGYGTEALREASISSASDVYAFGNGAAKGLAGDVASLYAFGNETLEGASVTGSSQIFAYGSLALFAATLDTDTDIYAFGTSALSGANLTNSSGIYAIGNNAGIALTGNHTNIIILGEVAPNSGAHDAVIVGTSMALQLSGNTNRYTDNGTTLLRNGSPISATGDTTATNRVAISQSGTNLSAPLDFSLVSRGGVFYITLTNNLFVGTPTGLTTGTFDKAWLAVRQPSTGTCFVTFTNGTFAYPESNPWINDTNGGAVVWYEMLANPFTNGQIDLFMSQRVGR